MKKIKMHLIKQSIKRPINLMLITCLMLSLLLSLLLISGCSTTDQTAKESLTPENQTVEKLGIDKKFWEKGHLAKISRVIDGDTVVLDFEKNLKKVVARLIGINTPEVKSPYTYEQCFGPQASAKLKSLVLKEAKVFVLTDVDTLDRYDRLLVYLFRASNGEFINKTMLEEGYARILDIAPNNAFQKEFKTAEAKAKSQNLGLWNACKNYN